MSKNGFGKQGAALLRRRWLARAQKRNSAERERTEPRRADGTALSAEKRAVAEHVKRKWLTDETAGPQPCGGNAQKAAEPETEWPARAAGCESGGCAEHACAAHGCCEFVQCARKNAELDYASLILGVAVLDRMAEAEKGERT